MLLLNNDWDDAVMQKTKKNMYSTVQTGAQSWESHQFSSSANEQAQYDYVYTK